MESLKRQRFEPRSGMQAKIKSFDPLTSVGPPARVSVVEHLDNRIRVIAERAYLPKTLVQVLIDRHALLGEVVACEQTTDSFWVDVSLVDLDALAR